MTRVRVLLRAKALLLSGYHPQNTIHGSATDAVDNVVAYMHPTACRFTLVGAIDRAVFDLTGDDYRKREALTDAAFRPLVKRAGGFSGLRKIATGAVEGCLELLINQLTEWDN